VDDDDDGGLRRRLLDGGLVLFSAPFVAASLIVLLFYVLGNGVNDGALALATLPVLLLAGPYLLANPQHQRRGAILAASLLLLDLTYAAWRITRVVPDDTLSLCVDGACGQTAPWLARLVREDETAFAGMALSGPLGLLSDEEAPVIESATRRVYAELDTLRGGRPGPNGVALSSDAEHVTALVSMPHGDGPVPAIIALHGFGGLLTPYVSTLARSSLGEKYAIVAPALDMKGYWWEPHGRDVLARTLATLPARIDRSQLWLVGISNGAIGAHHLAADPELGPRFRGTVLLVGAGLDLSDIATSPLLFIPGTKDVRFPLHYVEASAEAMVEAGVDVTWSPVEGDHFILFTHPAEVTERMARWLERAPIAARPTDPWTPLLPGLEFAELDLPVSSFVGDSVLRVVRVDPAVLDLGVRMASAEGGRPRPVSEWMDRADAVAAINPSMFREDYLASVGLLTTGTHVNSARWAPQQNSLLAFDPVSAAAPPAHLYSVGCEARADAEARYRTLIQSIRLLGCAGENLWSDQPKEWSAALVGQDHAGRVLLIHVRSPYRIHALVDQLKALPLDLRALHYGEGGPEAFLAIRTPALTATWTGSWETGFNENDDATTTGDLPNVLVVTRPTAAGTAPSR
jgi:dienelactone hydrolase